MSELLISNSDSNTSYGSHVAYKLNQEILNDSTESWIQYLRDHRSLIKEHSDHIDIDGETIHKFKYRIRKYLYNINMSYEELELAFRIVNRLNNDRDFNEEITEVYLPRYNYIVELRKMYVTVQSQI